MASDSMKNIFTLNKFILPKVINILYILAVIFSILFGISIIYDAACIFLPLYYHPCIIFTTYNDLIIDNIFFFVENDCLAVAAALSVGLFFIFIMPFIIRIYAEMLFVWYKIYKKMQLISELKEKKLKRENAGV